MAADELTVAVAQMNSYRAIDENLAWMTQAIADAAADGCDWVTFPENAPLLGPDTERLAQHEPMDGHQISTLREAAANAGVHVLVGSFAETGPDPERTYNTSVLIDRTGQVTAVYRKMHLFDVTVSDDTTFRESDTVCAGPAEPVLAEVDGWKVGLSICYDLRFAELYRALSAAGAEVLCIPAAFTYRTGTAHWHVLQRARAIENFCFVLAPAQVGRHYGRRESYGHAIAVAPWGEVIADAGGQGERWVRAVLSRDALTEARGRIPALGHRRM